MYLIVLANEPQQGNLYTENYDKLANIYSKPAKTQTDTYQRKNINLNSANIFNRYLKFLF